MFLDALVYPVVYLASVHPDTVTLENFVHVLVFKVDFILSTSHKRLKVVCRLNAGLMFLAIFFSVVPFVYGSVTVVLGCPICSSLLCG